MAHHQRRQATHGSVLDKLLRNRVFRHEDDPPKRDGGLSSEALLPLLLDERENEAIELAEVVKRGLLVGGRGRRRVKNLSGRREKGFERRIRVNPAKVLVDPLLEPCDT